MRIVERHIRKDEKALEEITFKAARLYNFCNYYKRKVCFGEVEPFSEYELTGLLAEYDQHDFRNLPSTTAQQVVRLLFKDWGAYFKAKKDYKKNPSKYKSSPRIPKYKKKNGCAMAIFTSQQIKIKDGFLHFPKKAGIEPVKTRKENIKQVRIVPKTTCFVIEIIYEVETVMSEVDEKNFLSIDLGLNNLATSVNNVGAQPFIINGKVVKSVNQNYNKRKAELMSFMGDKGVSNKIRSLTHNRNNFIEDKLHKISRYIVDYCVGHKIGTIVVGHNKGWKQKIKIGKRNNQNFVSIPHSKLIDKIRYKAELVGVRVEVTEESYTSKIDHLAYEKMSKQENYLGKRSKRGLFQSSTGKLINADVNGAVGIARKVFGDSVIEQIFDSGLAFNPVRVDIV